jgi:hypothetical protein
MARDVRPRSILRIRALTFGHRTPGIIGLFIVVDPDAHFYRAQINVALVVAIRASVTVAFPADFDHDFFPS